MLCYDGCAYSPIYQLGLARHLVCASDQGESQFYFEHTATHSSFGLQIYSVNRTKPLTARRLKQLEENGQGFLPLSQPLEFSVQPFEEYEAAYQKDPREPKD